MEWLNREKQQDKQKQSKEDRKKNKKEKREKEQIERARVEKARKRQNNLSVGLFITRVAIMKRLKTGFPNGTPD